MLDIVLMETVSGTVNRKSDGKKITDNITARNGKYNRTNKTVVLTGDVRVDSSNGDFRNEITGPQLLYHRYIADFGADDSLLFSL